MSDVMMLRIGIAVVGVILIIAMVIFGRPKKAPQGRRVESGERGDAARVEPSLGGDPADPDYSGEGVSQPDLGLADPGAGDSDLGKRPGSDFDKIISLYVAAKSGQMLRGEDIVVAAEKTGLTFGHMNVFHRLIEHHPERGPVFSMANIMQPGSFDMAAIRELETPAIAFFLTLPAPMTALDAWEMMLPNVQRMAELLDGVVLDDSRNALGRQRIQHIREELRGYDRQHEAPPLSKAPRW
ncbi:MULTISPECIES: cell division protein ZipA [Pseudoxanthomonas]|jgi:cell division protein ZipA|uniref:Cell division protein ZipA n=1 Tax=Pseudoxanthomonas winnipegensis TaxID=2480810 RepID=A0A4Q8LI86_9GAMM|nr:MULTISPECIES: cell division protein ZipA [Pseudoxanthomonas]MDQ1118775.1 cell division protein ZipA [Pseudoxanthomonas winnipegensis]MDQ1131962.1 cell division protein ZipA [Pseudoxanthomonas winnipegensis]MDR6138024.1 cell division protein ZipA [Pseudoxanthomonas sp. SORGH_AS_0997]RZZ87511.1 cell division protein ZipA [Pseudoxanthomonas winnipegensis]TAA07236.1 cell division protein ZipA [Pseudoxanthomonas winnipegensis]